MHEKGRDLRGGPRSGSLGGWRRLPKRLGAVTVELALGVRETVAGHRPGALERGGGGGAMHPTGGGGDTPGTHWWENRELTEEGIWAIFGAHTFACLKPSPRPLPRFFCIPGPPAPRV